MLWLLGYSANSESFKAAKARTKQAADKLEALAAEHGAVLLAGHGLFNRLLAKKLINRGWNGPKSPASGHWGYGVYTHHHFHFSAPTYQKKKETAKE